MKKLLSIIMAITLVVTSVRGVPVRADGENHLVFKLTDSDGSVVSNVNTLSVTTDQDGNSPVSGSFSQDGDAVLFAPLSEMEDGTYYYSIDVEGYETAKGDFELTPSSRHITVSLTKTAPVAQPVSSRFAFEDEDGKSIEGAVTLSIYTDRERENVLLDNVSVSSNPYTLDLPQEAEAGDILFYTAACPGHENGDDAFVAGEDITVILRKIAEEAGTVKFVDENGTVITEGISFFTPEQEEIAPQLNGEAFMFSGFIPGDEVSYKVNVRGYEEATGAVTLTDSEQTITVSLAQKQVEQVFELSDQFGALNGKPVSVKVYLDNAYSTLIGEYSFTNGSNAEMLPLTVLEGDTLYYEASSSAHATIRGAFEAATTVQIVLTRLLPDHVLFVDGNGEPLGAEMSFRDSDENPISVGLDEYGYDFSGMSVQDEIFYTAKKSGYIDKSGSFTLTSETQTIVVDMEELHDPKLDAEEILITYRDAALDLLSVLNKADGYDGDISFKLLEGDDVVSLNETFISPIKTGTAKINVVASETPLFASKEIDVLVTVRPYDLGELKADSFQWSVTEKVYDGKIEVEEVVGTYNGDDAETGVRLTVTASLETASKDVGEQFSKLKDIALGLDENYTFTYDETLAGPVITINPLPIVITPDDVVVSYGSRDWSTIKGQALPVPTNELLNFDTEEEMTEELKDLDFTENISYTVSENSYYVGKYTGAVLWRVDNKHIGNFVIADIESSDIEVLTEEPREDIWQYVKLDESESENAVVVDGTIYVAENGTAKLVVTGTDLYDSVDVVTGRGATDTVYGTDIETITGFYLYVQESPGTRTTSEEGEEPVDHPVPDNAIVLDNAAPNIVSGLAVNNNAQGVPVLVFEKESFSTEASATDALSGLKSFEFAIVSLENAVNLESVSWTNITNGSVKLSEMQDGVYSLVLKAVDNVGNTSIKYTDGIAIDSSEPVVSITGIEENTLYNENVSYNIHVSDEGATRSGIEKLTVTMTMDGETVSVNVDPSEYKNSFSLSKDVLNTILGVTEPLTADVLFDMEGAVIDATAQAIKSASLVTITVTAIDRARNEASETVTFAFDVDVPVVNISYDNNAAENDKFFKQDRTATIVVEDDNIDDEGISFSMSIDGTEEEFTVGELLTSTDSRFTFAKTGDMAYTILFNKDADYAISVSATDKAGNESNGMLFAEGTVAGEVFVIDKKLPVVGLEREGKEDGTEVTITVTEKNFDPAGLSLDITQLNAVGDDVDAYSVADARAFISDKANWIKSDDTWTIVLPAFTGDANYTVSLSVTDMAGNRAEKAVISFVIDKTAPTGEIVVEETKKSTELSDSAAFEFIKKDSATFSVAGEDLTSKVVSIKCFVYPVRTETDSFSVPVEELENFLWSDYDGDFDITEVGRFVIYARVEDAAGNVTFINSPYAIIIDRAEPQIEVSGIEDSGIYKDDIEVTIDVYEINDTIFSGLSAFTYTVLKNGEETQRDERSYSELTEEDSWTITIDSDINNSNDVCLIVTALDRAGNETVLEIGFGIDITEPAIEIEFGSESYYTSQQTMNVTVTERDPENIKMLLTVDGVYGEYTLEELSAIEGIRVEEGSDSQAEKAFINHTDERTKTFSITFGTTGVCDHDYSVAFVVKDMAGNETKTDVTSFTIDKASPELELSFEANEEEVEAGLSESSRKYTNTVVTVKANARDRNGNEDGVVFYVVGKDADGNEVINENVGVLPDDNNEAVYELNTDANYVVWAEYTDMAGNKASTVKYYISVDTKAPTGELITSEPDAYTGTPDSIARPFITKDDFYFTVDNTEDETSGLKSVKYFIKDHENVMEGIQIPQDMESVAWTEYESKIEVTKDRYFVALVRLEDKSGNIGYISTDKGIIVDKTAPSIHVTGVETDAIYNGDFDITIIAKDNSVDSFSGIDTLSYYFTEAGDKFGEKAESCSDSLVPSKEITEIFTADEHNSNDLSLVIIAADKAGNEERVVIPFMVDTISPEVSVEFEEDKEFFNESPEMRINILEREIASIQFVLSIDEVEGVYAYEELLSINGINVSEITDTEDNVENKKLTDGRDTSFTITFGTDADADHNYKISIKVVDAAGNETETDTYAFVVDKVSPTLTAGFTAEEEIVPAGEDENGRTYYNKALNLNIKASDRNLNKDGLTVYIKGTNSASEEVVNEELSLKLNEDGEYSYTLSQDANYVISASYEDLAGNSVSIDDMYITVDKTQPTGSILVDINGNNYTYDSLSNIVSFKDYSNQLVAASWTAVDGTSGIKTLSYYLHTPDQTEGGTVAALTEDELEGAAWNNLENSISLTDEQQGVLYIRVEDKAGNVTFLGTSDVLVVDKTSSHLEIEINVPDAYANGDVPFKVTAAEVPSGGTYAGLKELRFTITNNGAVTQEGNFTQTPLTAEGRTVLAIIQDVFSAALNNSNNVSVHVYSEDFAGNVEESEAFVMIDTTKPSIDLASDSNDAIQNKEKVVKVTLTERDLDALVVVLSVDGEEAEYSLEELSRLEHVSVSEIQDTESEKSLRELTDNRTYSFELVFGTKSNEDHDYKVSIKASDKAGNNAESDTISFTVDRVDPDAELTFREGETSVNTGKTEEERSYHLSPVDILIKVSDRNMKNDGVVLHVSGKDSEGNSVINEGQSLSVNEDGIVSVVMEDDANYVVWAEYTDLAGNRIETEWYFFSVDVSLPEGNIIFEDMRSAAYSEAIVTNVFKNETSPITITGRDGASGVSSVRYYIQDVSGFAESFNALSEEELSAISWRDYEGPINIDADSAFVVYARLEDKSGNVTYINTEYAIVFDKTTPIIGLTGPEGGAIYSEDVEFSVTATDILLNPALSGLKSVEYYITQGETKKDVTLDMFSSPLVKAYESSGKIVASYHNSNNLVFHVIAEDYAGNKAELAVPFVMDTIPPTVDVQLDTSAKYFNSEQTASVTVTERDLSKLRFILSVDGEEASYTLDELKRIPHISVSDIEDSQSEKDILDLDDTRTYSFTVSFGTVNGEDHDYSFAVKATDKAGNEAMSNGFELTVDRKAPELGVSFTADASQASSGLSEEERTYYNTGIVFHAAISERNLDKNSLKVHITGKSADETVLVDKVETPVLSDDGTANVVLDVEANYTITAEYTDLAGNTVRSDTHYITMDKTAPAGSIAVSIGGENLSYNEFYDISYYNYYTNDAVSASWTAKDSVSGIADVSYYLHVPAEMDSSSVDGLTAFQLASVSWSSVSQDIVMSSEQQAVLYVRLTDKAGNVTYLSTKDMLVVDKTQGSIQINTQDPGSYSNADVPFEISVSDIVSGGTYAGLKSIRFEVLANGSVTQTGEFEASRLTPQSRTMSVTLQDSFKAVLNNSNDVVLNVYAEDYAGNTFTATASVMIDTTEPKIDIGFDEDKEYFNEEKEMVITITERDLKDAVFHLAIDGEEKDFTYEELSSISHIAITDITDSQEGKGLNEYTDERQFTLTIMFGIKDGEDHDYAFSVTANDKAGHKTSSREYVFTVDQVVPEIEISVSLDGKDVEAGKEENKRTYYNNDLTIHAFVKERNLDVNNLKFHITGHDLKGDTVIDSENAALLDEGGNGSVFLNNEANYIVYATYEDRAGNIVVSESVFVTIDKTAPSGSIGVEIGGTELNYTSYKETAQYSQFTNGEFKAAYAGNDAISGILKTEYYMHKPNSVSEPVLSGLSIETLESLEWNESPKAITVTDEGQYVIYVRVTDKAGNVSYVSTHDILVVDKSAAKIRIETQDKNVYANTDVPFVIIVSEALSGTYSGVKSISYQIKNNDVVTKEASYEASALAVEKRAFAIDWNGIFDSAMNNGNKISITVTAEDHAGNESVEEEWVLIDTVAPVIDIQLDTSAKYFNSEQTASVTVTERDLSKLRFILSVDGEEASYTLDELKRIPHISVSDIEDSQSEKDILDLDDTRTYSFTVSFGTVNGEDHDYSFAVKATDKAGNEAMSNGFELTVDRKAPELGVSFTADASQASSGLSEEERTYYNTGIVFHAAISERNLDKNSLKVHITGKSADETVLVDKVETPVLSDDGTANVVLDVEANYTITAEYTDLAGNTVRSDTHYITMDKTAPAGSIAVSIGGENLSYNEFYDISYYNYYTNDAVSASWTAKDSVSGIADVSYYLHVPAEMDSSSVDGLTAFQLASVSWSSVSQDIVMSSEQQAVLYVRLTDKAGNVTYLSTKDMLVVDKTQGSIQINTQDPGSYSNADVPFEISVSDIVSGGTYAGLKSIRFEVLANGSVTQTGEFEASRLTPQSRTMSVTLQDSFKAVLNNSNDVVLNVYAEDHAGNTFTATTIVMIDTTAPTVNTQMDASQGYYNSEQTMSVTITERDIQNISFNVTIDGVAGSYTLEQLGAMSHISVSATSDSQAGRETTALNDDRAVSFTITFGTESGEDHDYVVSISVTDKAGNASTSGEHTFTVDRVPPTIAIDLMQDGQVVQKGESDPDRKFYKERVSIRITASDRNQNDSGLSVTLTGTDNSGATIVSRTENVSIGANGVAMLEITESANYAVSATYTDKAGNKVESSVYYFTMDMDAPVGSIVLEGASYTSLPDTAVFDIFSNTPVYFNVTAGDNVSGIQSVQYATLDMSSSNDDRCSITGLEKDIAWKSADGELSITPNSQVVIIARIEDKSGNVTYIASPRGVVVDNISPELTVSGFDPDTVYPGDVEVSVVATDALASAYSGLREVGFTVKTNGRVTQSGTFPLSSGRIGELKDVVRVLAADNNSNDITIEIVATDRAGNKTIVTKTMNIDRTAPSVTVVMDETKTYFNETVTASITITERDVKDIVFEVNIDGVKGRYTLDELRRLPDIEVSQLNDSGRGKEGSDLTDDRTTSFTVAFGTGSGCDHDYVFSVHVSDKAGNEVVSKDYSFTVDKVVPGLSLSFSAPSGQATYGLSQDGRTYYNEQLTLNALATDRNAREDGLVLFITGYDLAGNVTLNTTEYTRLSTLGAASLNLPQDANFEIYGEYTDLAGNKVVTPVHYITMDRVMPSGQITLSVASESNTYTDRESSIRFRFFTNDTAIVTWQASDDISGVAEIAYFLDTPAESATDIRALSDGELAGVNWTVTNGSITISEESQCVVYIRIKDKAGNIRYVSTNEAFSIDRTAPTSIEIRFEEEKEFYNSDVPFTIVASDTAAGGTYSGLRSVEFEVVSNDVVTQRGSLSDEALNRSARTIFAQLSDVIAKEKNNSNNVVIRVTATDYAGNTATAEKTLKIDSTSPVVDISFSRTDAANELYYNGARSATIRVTERNLDIKDVNIRVNAVNGSDYRIGSWITSPDMGASDSAVSELTIWFDSDDDYTISVDAVDMAGNVSNTVTPDRFVIDTIAPTITLRFDNNNVWNEMYYKAPRLGTIEIRDQHFNQTDLVAEIGALIAGGDTGAPAIKNWTSANGVHTVSIDFINDGKYALKLTARDLAGNESETLVEPMFIIDTIKPVLRIEGLTQDSSYNGILSPVIIFEDENAGDNRVGIVIHGTHNGEIVLGQSLLITDNGGRIELSNFEDTKDSDDRYTLTASFTDLAGNTTTEIITFSVNRFGSVFELREDADAIGRFYVYEPGDVTLYETNVDKLVNAKVAVGVNGDVIELEEGKDYTVEMTEGPGGYTYRYTIKKDVFDKEGVYEIIVTSSDGAGNEQTNNLKGFPVSFVVDKTAPICVITGIENNGRYNDTTRQIVVVTQDEIATGAVDVFLNGELFRTFSSEEVIRLGGRLVIELPAGNDYQTIYAVAKDAAGNITQTDELRFLLTTDAWMQFYRNTPLFIGSILGVSTLTGGIFFIIAKKKREEEEEEEGKTQTEEL